eukprot:CAMPEP_0196252090 /NCGR_PEP_ID=MMETSP0913-20130531/48867_1 /TAXON_ID=49265 /ORGANISM="Thalassiosira rotula, Strain GSO102" /LENGTH=30 /DNA_ID= /DNA_START= /DNA_END= /DNA_ORIENTATION=
MGIKGIISQFPGGDMKDQQTGFSELKLLSN